MHTELAFDDADLNGFVDGRIEPSRAAALAASLARDPEAALRMEAWRRQNDTLRTMFASVLSEPVPVRLLPAVVPPRHRPAAGTLGEGRPAGRLAGVVATTSIGMGLIGFALGALASVGTDGFGLAAPPPGLPRAATAPDARDLATRAAEAHRTFLSDPSRAQDPPADDGPKVEHGLARRLGGDFRVPSLAQQGWTLLGGRVVPGRHGPAAFLVFGSGTDRLGLTVSRGETGDDGRVLAVDDAAPSLGVATWTDGDLGYALTTDRGREWLSRNLDALRDGVRAQERPPAPGGENAPRP